MYSVTYVCDECGRSITKDFKSKVRALPTKPRGWKKANLVLRCSKCWDKKQVEEQNEKLSRGPFWVCFSCLSVVSNSVKGRARHVQRYKEATLNPHTHIKRWERWPGRFCKPPEGTYFYGPFVDGDSVRGKLDTLVQLHSKSLLDEGIRFGCGWPESKSDQLREDAHKLLISLSKEQ